MKKKKPQVSILARFCKARGLDLAKARVRFARLPAKQRSLVLAGMRGELERAVLTEAESVDAVTGLH